MHPADIGILTNMLNSFVFVISGGFSRTLPDALWLLKQLATLEIILFGLLWARRGDDQLPEFLMKVLWLGFIFWVVTSWKDLSWVVMQSMVQVGLHIGGDSLDMKTFLDPSEIMRYGMGVIGVIFTKLTAFSGFGAIMNLPQLFIMGLAAIGIWLAYFILAAQVFIKVVEFYMMATLTLILLPFGAFRHSTFLTEKAFAAVIGHSIGLGVLAIITSMILPFLLTLRVSADPTLPEAFTVLSASLLMGILAWQAPSMAAGMLMGAPSLQAGTLAQGALAATAGAILGAAGVDRISRGIIGATGAATSATAALATALRGGGRGLGQLALQSGASVAQPAAQYYRQAAQRGSAFARGETLSSNGSKAGGHAASWYMAQARQTVPPPAQPPGRNTVDLGD